jgi:uncharacterized protein (TIGR02466 family)
MIETVPVFSSFITANDQYDIDLDHLRNIIPKLLDGKQQYHFNGDEEGCQPLFNSINNEMNRVWKEVLYGSDEYYTKITDIWASMGSADYIVEPHQHPLQSLTGVFYVTAESSQLKFLTPVPQVMDKYPQTPDYMTINSFNSYNSSTWTIPCKSGVMLVFPSYLTHYVENKDGEDRISIAFNAEIERK